MSKVIFSEIIVKQKETAEDKIKGIFILRIRRTNKRIFLFWPRKQFENFRIQRTTKKKANGLWYDLFLSNKFAYFRSFISFLFFHFALFSDSTSKVQLKNFKKRKKNIRWKRRFSFFILKPWSDGRFDSDKLYCSIAQDHYIFLLVSRPKTEDTRKYR